jgi:adenosylcobinamide-GDP ribazoletransferase
VWAGFLIGGVAYVPLKLLQLAGVPWHQHPALVATLVLAAWALFTRFLHWDGLADTADGWFGADPERRREIAFDTHIGAFGATSIALLALVEYAALTAVLVDHELIVLIVPAFARLAATSGAWFGHAAKPTGLGAAVTRKPSIPGFLSAAAGALLAGLLLAGGYRKPGLAVGILGIVLAVVVPHLISKRFGGVTGDVLGASILIVEVLLFAAAAMVV